MSPAELSFEKTAEQLQKASGWIPQLFFDLIARVIPGIFLIPLFVLSLFGMEGLRYSGLPWKELAASGPTVACLALFLPPFAYVLSVVLSGGWYSAWLGLQQVFPPLKEYDSETGVRKRLQLEAAHLECSLAYDTVKRDDPAAGNRITKLKAEMHMSQVLIVGLLACLLVNGW